MGVHLPGSADVPDMTQEAETEGDQHAGACGSHQLTAEVFGTALLVVAVVALHVQEVKDGPE